MTRRVDFWVCSLGCVLVVATCGGSSSKDAVSDAGTAFESDEVCTPTGTWVVVYTPANDCLPHREELVVRAEGDGFVVDYDPTNVLGEAPPGTGSVSPDGCTITATGVQSFPAPEDGGRVVELQLNIEGDTASGTLSYAPYSDRASYYCWESGSLTATATRS